MQDLKTLLNATVYGRKLLNDCKENNYSIKKEDRKEIVTNIVNFWIKTKSKLTPQNYLDAFSEIKLLFPKEKPVSINFKSLIT